jgi:hypothetical protein
MAHARPFSTSTLCVINVQMAHAKPFLTSTLQDLSNGIKKHLQARCFDPCNWTLNFRPSPHFGSVNVILTFLQTRIATHHLWDLMPLPFKWKQTPLASSHPTYCDNMLHYILFIKYFILQKHKIWNFISYWNFVQMKWFEFIFYKTSIMYIITFISFWKCKFIWTIFL